MEIEQIKKKIQYGDFITSKKSHSCSRNSWCIDEFLQNIEDAIKAMAKIQDNREELIKNYREKNN